MYILYAANGQDIIHSCDTSKEMAEYLGIKRDSVRRRVQNHKKRMQEPDYEPKSPFIIREDTRGYTVDWDKVIHMAREGYRPEEIARAVGASRFHVARLMDELVEEIGEIKGATKEYRHVKALRPEWASEWERATRACRESGYDLSKIPLVKE